MTTNFTPGPWRWIPADNLIEAPGGGRLIDVIPRSICCSQAERDANARLIAAAPELLEALQGVVDAYGCECLPNEPKAHCPMCIGRAAIAKATTL